MNLTGLLQLVGVYYYNSITKRGHEVVFLSKTFETNRSQIELFEIKSGQFFSINSLPPDIGFLTRLGSRLEFILLEIHRKEVINQLRSKIMIKY